MGNECQSAECCSNEKISEFISDGRKALEMEINSGHVSPESCKYLEKSSVSENNYIL